MTSGMYFAFGKQLKKDDTLFIYNRFGVWLYGFDRSGQGHHADFGYTLDSNKDQEG
jgi:hypothetical protein